MSASVAVYAGTFDPMTCGHTDIVERALRLFDTVHVAVVQTSSKIVLFSGEERQELAREALKEFGSRVVIEPFEGLLVDHVRRKGAKVIIRGLRAVTDYDYEAQMALMNRHLDEGIETVFLMTSLPYAFVSSSIVRNVARNRGSLEGIVPPNVQAALERVYP